MTALVMLARLAMLQWGRAGKGAETPAVAAEGNSNSQLQWGRAGKGAETWRGSFLLLWTPLLQWGRAGKGAETRIKPRLA